MSRAFVVVALVLLAGCDVIIGLKDVPPDVGDADAADAAMQDSSIDAAVDAVVDACAACPSGLCANGDCVRRIFVTNGVYDGAIGGLQNADNECTAAAAQFITTNTPFRAWLSDGASSPSTWTVHGSAPYVLVDGTRVADDWAGLTSGALKHAIDENELGNAVAGEGVWTETSTSGTPISGTTNACKGWTSNSGTDTAAAGTTSAMNGGWTNATVSTCNATANHLYCVEQ